MAPQGRACRPTWRREHLLEPKERLLQRFYEDQQPSKQVAPWFIKEVIAPSVVHADGIWLDGIGPDNGAYMCSGVCCGYGAENSPLVQNEIDAHCKAQTEATTQVQKYLIANGGWGAQACFGYKSGSKLPGSKDTPAQARRNCALV